MHIARAFAAGPFAHMRWLVCAALLLAAGPGVTGSDDARDWVMRMNQALTGRNYDGVFIHRLGERRETLRIIHRVRGDTMTERLVSTDGSGREFVRNGTEWIAYFPDRRIVVVERRSRSGFIAGLQGVGTVAESHYDIRDVEKSKFQGRATRLITVASRDAYRYGYRFWIDEKSAMPVKTQLVGANKEVIEEIAFVSLAMPENIDDELLKPDVDASTFRWMRRDIPEAERAVAVKFAPREDRLPPGFRVSSTHARTINKSGFGNSRMVFTDGLAWVSVFIEPANLPPLPTQSGEPRSGDGAAQVGASATYTARIDDFRVTAVGEVPPATVKAIAESLRPQP